MIQHALNFNNDDVTDIVQKIVLFLRQACNKYGVTANSGLWRSLLAFKNTLKYYVSPKASTFLDMVVKFYGVSGVEGFSQLCLAFGATGEQSIWSTCWRMVSFGLFARETTFAANGASSQDMFV